MALEALNILTSSALFGIEVENFPEDLIQKDDLKVSHL